MVGSCYQNCSGLSSLARSSRDQSTSCPPVFLNKVVTKLEEEGNSEGVPLSRETEIRVMQGSWHVLGDTSY